MDHGLHLACIAACLFLLVCASCQSAQLGPGQFDRSMESEGYGQAIGYRLIVPAADAPDEGWPLLLFLHGAGERGNDLSRVLVHGPLKLTDRIPELSRCVLLAPQCPPGRWWRAEVLKALLDEAQTLADVDTSRLYLTGLSMGGYGAWSLLARHPDLFAAAIPICGGGDPNRLWNEIESDFDLDGLLRAKDVAIHAFHGEADSVIPVEESRFLVRALEEIGANVELTTYPGVGHDSWTQTYEDPELYVWLFEQRSQ